MADFPSPNSALWADVLVLRSAPWATTDSPFYLYSVPEDLRRIVAAGQLALVPFGSELVMGIIWSLDSAANNFSSEWETQNIKDIMDTDPVLDETRRKLAEWLSETYLTPLEQCVRVIIPGIAPRTKIVLRAQNLPESNDTFSATEKALLGYLRSGAPIDEKTAREALGAQKGAKFIHALEQSGAIMREAYKTKERSSSEIQLRLAVTTETAETWRGAAMQELAPPDTRPIMREEKQPKRRAIRKGKGGFLREIASNAAPYAHAPIINPLLPVRRAAQLRAAIAIIDMLLVNPAGEHGLRETMRIARAPQSALNLLLQDQIIIQENPAEQITIEKKAAPHILNEEQTNALRMMIDAMDAGLEQTLLSEEERQTPELQRALRPILLFGVTGSGKTEVYLQALAAAIESGRRGLALVPEIALTPQTLKRFESRFPGKVAALHSALTPQERLKTWRKIRRGEADVVIGSRSALFAPLANIGLIILDEEHDASYKQDSRQPMYHTRDAAIFLGRMLGAAVVLGSATPAVETFYRAQTGEYALAELRQRPAAAAQFSVPAAQDTAEDTALQVDNGLSPVAIVDLRDELQAGHTSILSRMLLQSLRETMEKKEQAILFLNRRGAASCVLCRSCGYVARCGHCDAPLTFHLRESALLCHYCGWREPQPNHCLRCGSDQIRYFGVGAERVEATVRELFPKARVLRWDADTARGLKEHQRFSQALLGQEADIIIGTQMIAKGLDAPLVTLVGIIAADIALYLPDYRANERIFQTLTQVAGRAGRGDKPGNVILQTFNPQHFCIETASRHDYRGFYATEISARAAYGYPPLRRFIKMTFAHKDRRTTQLEALAMGDYLGRVIANIAAPDTDIVGPAPAFMEKARDYFHWQLIIRSPDPAMVLRAIGPHTLKHGWSIDVDPMSSL